MKLELEKSDIESIAQRVIELLRPVLSSNGKKEQDIIFDVPGLAEYLKVSRKWIYEKTHYKEIPYIKIGGQLRFRKKDIDKWLDEYNVPTVRTQSKFLLTVKGKSTS